MATSRWHAWCRKMVAGKQHYQRFLNRAPLRLCTQSWDDFEIFSTADITVFTDKQPATHRGDPSYLW